LDYSIGLAAYIDFIDGDGGAGGAQGALPGLFKGRFSGNGDGRRLITGQVIGNKLRFNPFVGENAAEYDCQRSKHQPHSFCHYYFSLKSVTVPGMPASSG